MAKRDMRKVNEAIERAILKAAFDMLGYSQRICPVDTGRLRESIKMKIENNQIVLYTDVEYASYVEYGTRMMTQAHGKHDPMNPVRSWKALRKRGGSGQMMPFIRPALHMGIKKFIPERLKQELRNI